MIVYNLYYMAFSTSYFSPYKSKDLADKIKRLDEWIEENNLSEKLELTEEQFTEFKLRFL